MFQSWGYFIGDAAWLQDTVEEQALEKYKAGEYALGMLDARGQRLNIRIEIPRKDRDQMVSFITGWIVEPQGTIRLVTP